MWSFSKANPTNFQLILTTHHLNTNTIYKKPRVGYRTTTNPIPHTSRELTKIPTKLKNKNKLKAKAKQNKIIIKKQIIPKQVKFPKTNNSVKNISHFRPKKKKKKKKT